MHGFGSLHVTGFRHGCVVVLLAAVLVPLCGGLARADNDAAAAQRIIFDPNAEPSWTHTVPSLGDGTNNATDVKITKAGAIYVAGGINTATGVDVSLMKYAEGAPAWASPRTYDGNFHGDDFALAMALGANDVIYTAGGSESAAGHMDVLLVKWSKSGKRLWTRRYDGPGHGHDLAADVGVDKAGNVTILAASVSAGGSLDYAVVSWTPGGARRWVWRYDGSFHGIDDPAEMHVAAGGTIYVTGMSQVEPAKMAMLTARLSSAGKKLWSRRYAGPADLGASASALMARPGGGVYVAGSVHTPAAGIDGLVVRYTTAGVRTDFTPDTGAGGATHQSFADVTVASTKQVVAVGSDNGNPRVVVYSPAGAVSHALSVPSAGADSFRAVAADSFGGYYVTGTGVLAPGNTKVFSGRGSVITGGGGWLGLWGPAFVSTGNYPTAVAARGTTAVVVGGCMSGPATGTDQFVLGYVY